MELEKIDSRPEQMIYEIRGKQVMLDSDLAKLYECKNGTKEINQAVRNNIEKFPERYSWVLTDEELTILRSKFLTANDITDNKRRNNPRIFTEQGVAMLATILKSKVATRVSIQIMDAFVAMRKYIGGNLLEQKYINNQVMKNTEDIKLLQESFSKFEEKKKVNEIYFNGQIYDAYSKICEIFTEAKEKLIIIDNYADRFLLDIIKNLDVKVTILTKKDSLLSRQDIFKYKKQYHNLEVIFNHTFHDRYFIIDEQKVYHCGASVNKIGTKTFSITEISDEFMVRRLMKKLEV